MTQEEKAKAYDEAVKRAKAAIDMAADKDLVGGVVRTIFPELAESEDERIRRCVLACIENAPSDCCMEVSRMEMRDWLEKQKEQDNEEGDFTIYHPQKNGEGKYKCIPFSFYGSLTSFSNDKDLMDFLNECFYDKEECERWCEIENKPELPECKHKIKKDSVFDYLCESSDDKKQKEQKHPNGCFTCDEYKKGYEEGRRNGFTAGYNKAMKEVEQKEQKPVVTLGETYHVDTLGTQQVIAGKMPTDKPAEWSEEDEEMLNSCISSIEESKENRYAYKENDGDTSYDREIAWLKALRPSWKPSEEQMKALEAATVRYQSTGLESLFEELKKL